jgi:pyridoxamine 5'-phosphate oxidase
MSIKIFLKTVRNLTKGIVTGLPEPTKDRDPIDLFTEWFGVARDSNIILPEAMTLATATADGRPSARMVLLKGFGEDGFTFFTNYGSRKADELESNPHAALTFHWEILQRQVRIEGTAHKISPEESAAYFATRALDSKLGAWASKQSKPLSSRNELEDAVKAMKSKFGGMEVPLPPFWGGYRLAPERIEFWQGRLGRLHDRLVWVQDGDGWRNERLYP